MTDRTDNFNRANGGLGTNWTTRTDANNVGSLVINGSKVVVNATSQDSVAYWSADSFANDQYSQFVFGGGAGHQASVGVAVRVSDSSTLKYYEFEASSGGFGSGIYYYDGTTWNTLTSTSDPVATDVVKITVTGTSLVVQLNGAGTFSSTTDASIASGFAGLHSYDTFGAASCDDWLGGPIAGGAAPPNGWWRDESERLTTAPLRFDTRGPAFVSTFRTAAIAGTAWHRNFPEANPKPPVRFQPPSAFVSTFRTAVISGIAWSRDETESKPWSPRRFQIPPAWDPQPIGVVVTAPPNGWLTTSADQPRRRPPIDQPVVVQFTPPQTAGWPQLAQDRLWPRFRLSDAVPAWNPADPTPQLVGWWMLAQDCLPLRVRLLLDVPAINLIPPATPSTIDGIAWFEPFDRLPRIPVPAPRDAAPAFGFPIVDTSVGIFGMSWFAPPDRDRPRFTPTVETFPAWGPQFIVQVAPPPSTGGDDFLVLARRRGRR